MAAVEAISYFDYVPTEQSALHEELRCAICLEFLLAPRSLAACDHTFCQRCLDERFATKRECPACRAAVSEAAPPRENVALARIVDNLQVFCPRKASHACSWQGPRSNAASHLASSCDTFACTQADCTWRGTASALGAHESAHATALSRNARCAALNPPSASLVRVSAGGRAPLAVSLAVLRRYPDSLLAHMFGESPSRALERDANGVVVLDMDGGVFARIVEYLRTGLVPRGQHQDAELLLHYARVFELHALVALLGGEAVATAATATATATATPMATTTATTAASTTTMTPTTASTTPPGSVTAGGATVTATADHATAAGPCSAPGRVLASLSNILSPGTPQAERAVEQLMAMFGTRPPTGFALLLSYPTGPTPASFHLVVDGVGPTLHVVRSKNGSVFGAFVQRTYTGAGAWQPAGESSFIFGLGEVPPPAEPAVAAAAAAAPSSSSSSSSSTGGTTPATTASYGVAPVAPQPALPAVPLASPIKMLFKSTAKVCDHPGFSLSLGGPGPGLLVVQQASYKADYDASAIGMAPGYSHPNMASGVLCGTPGTGKFEPSLIEIYSVAFA